MIEQALPNALSTLTGQVIYGDPEMPGWIASRYWALFVGVMATRGLAEEERSMTDVVGEFLRRPRTPVSEAYPLRVPFAVGPPRQWGQAVFIADGVSTVIDPRLLNCLRGLTPVRLGEGYKAPIGGVDADGDVVAVLMPRDEKPGDWKKTPSRAEEEAAATAADGAPL